MVIGSGWKPDYPFVDPMCGSGTLAIEAAMSARNIAPGLSRNFAFERWPAHDSTVWSRLQSEARAQVRQHAAAPLIASDRDSGAVEATTRNAERAGVRADIDITEAPLTGARFPGGRPGWIITNPPYGVRVGESRPLRNLYASLGQLARSRGYKLGLLSADRSLEAQLGIEMNEVFRTKNGGIPVRLVISDR
jgi:putative N6-adenine-specific DNA methylase